MMTQFVGRKKELEGLRGLLKKKIASLVVLRGRRRIGKSRLAYEYARLFPASYILTGIPPGKGVTAKDQRQEFMRQMRKLRIPHGTSDDWGDLLTDLADYCGKGRTLIVLDEITWMGSLDPTFLPKLKTIWDTHFKNNPLLILLLSGSNSAWIEKNIIGSTGFVGRISYLLRLEELPLHRCNEFWKNHRQISPYEKFKILAVTGGIPRYLEEIRPDLSAEQNLLTLCYKPTGLLVHEFKQIFSDLFTHRNQIYKEFIQALASGPATMSDIAKKTDRSKGGDLSCYLADLVEAGFIARDYLWNIKGQREERLSYFRVCDNYFRFYLKYIEPYKHRIRDARMESLPKGWHSIMGLQLENLVCNNSSQLIRYLEISPNDVIWSGPYYQMAGARKKGCQIDYLIQTKHHTLYLCEVKFSEREIPYTISEEVQEKARRLKIPRGWSARHVLIHVNGVSERIEQEETFSHLIDFSSFLEL